MRLLLVTIFAGCLFTSAWADDRTYVSPFGDKCVERTRKAYRISPFERFVKRALHLDVPVCTWGPEPVWTKSLSLGEQQFILGDDLITDVDIEIHNPAFSIVIYQYKVSAGKIVGNGAKVKWDLNGVPAGTYTIMAGVNDGAGVCGTVQTRRVEILECRACTLRETE